MSAEPIIVTVDPDLEALIPGFLDNRRKDLAALREALQRGDCQALQFTGHSLKGVGGGYGFNGLSEIGARIESLAKTRDVAGIGPQVDALADYLGRVQVRFG
jgi:HPt (histidine-containing phosphotransfer) domain-containing protein